MSSRKRRHRIFARDRDRRRESRSAKADWSLVPSRSFATLHFGHRVAEAEAKAARLPDLTTGTAEGAERRASNVQIHHVKCIVLDEFAALFDVFTHERGEDFLGGNGIFEAHFEQRHRFGVL